MEMAHLHLIWANKPECSRAIAEVWIGESDLWFTIFFDDDRTLKIEVFPSLTRTHVLDLAEMQRIIESAKSELLTWMSAPSERA
jgi:hypothetical protein